jgi:hypothetical protein
MSIEPELITIIEGPTPEFRMTPQDWVQSVHEGPDDRMVAITSLRTGNGEGIIERCRNAWQEGRSVKLDFPDQLRMRQQVDVISARLQQLEEGPMLQLWVSLPYSDVEEEDDDFDDFDDFEDEEDDQDEGLSFS